MTARISQFVPLELGTRPFRGVDAFTEANAEARAERNRRFGFAPRAATHEGIGMINAREGGSQARSPRRALRGGPTRVLIAP